LNGRERRTSCLACAGHENKEMALDTFFFYWNRSAKPPLADSKLTQSH
jgi:hypothetical protein